MYSIAVPIYNRNLYADVVSKFSDTLSTPVFWADCDRRAGEVLRTSGEVDDYCRHASRLSASHYATGIAHASVHLHYVLAVQITAVLYLRSSQTDILKITKHVIDYCFIIINSLYNYI